MKPNSDDSIVNSNNNLVDAPITIIPSFAYPYIPELSAGVQPMTDTNISVGHINKSENETVTSEIKNGILILTKYQDRRVSFQLPGFQRESKARPSTAANNKSRNHKVASEGANTVSNADGKRPQSAPGRAKTVEAQNHDRTTFNNYLESLIVVNFDKADLSKRPTLDRCSSRASSRAFERACRGRVRTGYNNLEVPKNDPKEFSGIIGTGTAVRPKTTSVLIDHQDTFRLETTIPKHSDSSTDLSVLVDNINFLNSQNNNQNGSQKKSQTVRNNVDKFQIEQITLRRLFFVIENNIEAPDHINMVDMLESSNVPADLIRSLFGPQIESLHDIRILLLQGIDNSRRRIEKERKLEQQVRNHKMAGMNLECEQHDEPEARLLHSTRANTIGRNPVYILPVKEKPTTPSEILTILKTIETKKAIGSRKFASLKGGGSASYARKAAKEANTLQSTNKNASNEKKTRWKPVSYRKHVQTDKTYKLKSAKQSMENLDTNLKERPTRIMDRVSILSPKNIIRMVEGRRASVFQ